MPILHAVHVAAASTATAANTNTRGLMPEAIRVLSTTFREMIAPQSACFHVVAVEGATVTHRTARAGDNAVPSAEAGDVIVEIGHDMDLEMLARFDTLSDLVCARIIGKVLHEREAGTRYDGVENAFLYTSAAMLLLLSNRDGWRLAASPNDVDHAFYYDGILDYAFYQTYQEVDGRRNLQNVMDFETRVKAEKEVLDLLVDDRFEQTAQGWYPLPHLTTKIGKSVDELVARGIYLREMQRARPAPAPEMACA
jgi:hypothetical protein